MLKSLRRALIYYLRKFFLFFLPLVESIVGEEGRQEKE